jgi:hypothetical protein
MSKTNIVDKLEQCDARQIRDAIDHIIENYWGELAECINENGSAIEMIESLRDY